MTVECFLDTNILIYAALGREKEEAKRKKANELIVSTDFGISVQVLQEFFTAVTRKTDRPLSAVKALEWIDYLVAQPCLPIDASLVRIAVEKSERYRINYWDAAILVAAETLGASVLYTEDLNHGQFYGALRVLNPFRK